MSMAGRSMVTVLGLVSLRFVAASFTETVKARLRTRLLSSSVNMGGVPSLEWFLRGNQREIYIFVGRHNN